MLDFQSKKVTFKYLNQLKLMIKPPARIIQLTGAFLTLLGGTISFIPYQIGKIEWTALKQLIKNPTEIIEIIGNPQVFIKRVRLDNLEKSIHMVQSIEDKSNDEMFDILYETVLHLQEVAKPLFKHQLQINKSTSVTRKTPIKMQKIQQQQPRSLSKMSMSNSGSNRKLNTVQSCQQEQKSQKKKTESKSPQSCYSRKSSSEHDFQKRVISAQMKKQTRLDKILRLSTNKPQTQSMVKQFIEGSQIKSVRSNSRESMLRQEIEKNHKDIRKLKVKEKELKWEIERESKQLKQTQIKEAQQDDISRYKINYEKDQELKKTKTKSVQKRVVNSQNYTPKQRQNTMEEQNVLQNLQQDCLLVSRRKQEMEESLEKILKNINRSNKKYSQQKLKDGENDSLI